MLTQDEIRKYPELENLTDEEARNIAKSLYKLSLIAYEVYDSQKLKEEIKKP